MITLAPINKKIQATLYEKIGMLQKNRSLFEINAPISEENGAPIENYMMTRVPFLRATSFTPEKETTHQAVVLMGGKLSQYGRLRSGFENRNVPVNEEVFGFKELNELGLYNKPNPTINDDIPFRPTAGINDVSIEYKGGGMKLGSTRSAEMNWTCWTWKDLNDLTPHFLHPGRTVLLEWGWSGIGKLKNVRFQNIFDDDSINLNETKLNNLQEKLVKHIIDQNGHYDAILGLVQSFDWTVRDDGGFDCVTELISPGITMLQQYGKNLQSKSYAQLPVLVEEKEDWGKWVPFADDTSVVWAGGPTDVESLAPYITFREYMQDFPDQVLHFIKEKGGLADDAWIDGGAKEYLKSAASRFQIIRPGHLVGFSKMKVKKIETKDKIEFLARNSGQSKALRLMGAGETMKNTPGKALYVTWGWFEDNVLSRFFGNVTEDGKVIGEFRSFEHDINQDGTFKYDDLTDNPIYTPTKFYNSRYLMTVDASKWLIPNVKDPVFAMRDTSDNTFVPMSDIQSVVQFDSSGCAIRDVYFNTLYLKEKLGNVSDLLQGVMLVWDEFSSLYGGVYRFKIDYDDNGKRVIIREQGYTAKRAGELLKKENKSTKENTTGLFVFPIWEDGSLVKSNTLTARLPDRMKIAAMYGANSIKKENNDKDDKVIGTFDELAGRAWGKLQNPLPTDHEGKTLEEIENLRYQDLLHGKIDFPSRGNRSFGQSVADISKKLTVGKAAEIADAGSWITFSDPNGTKIYKTILDEIEESSKAELQKRLAAEGGEDSTGESNDVFEIRKAYKALFSEVNILKNEKVNNQAVFYYDKIAGNNRAPAMKQEVLFIMQSLLRGDDEGVMSQVDPLIPVDFEMEIDGTGALFPGNSFQSSYLPDRYRKESLFQMVGVNQKIDSTGWTTTIKGQIRAISKNQLLKDKKDDKKDDKKKVPPANKRFDEKSFNENNTKGTPNFLGGIDALDAAHYLAGGQIATGKYAKRRAVTVVSLLNEQLAAGNDAWTKNKGLVTQLQTTLNRLGIDMSEYGGIDGGFGDGTKKALALFTSKFGEKIAGYSGRDLGTFKGSDTALVIITRGNILSHITTEGIQGYGYRGG